MVVDTFDRSKRAFQLPGVSKRILKKKKSQPYRENQSRHCKNVLSRTLRGWFDGVAVDSCSLLSNSWIKESCQANLPRSRKYLPVEIFFFLSLLASHYADRQKPRQMRLVLYSVASFTASPTMNAA